MGKKLSSMCMYSIVVPVYNEEESLEELYRRLTDVLKGLGESYEIIFINDGSMDRSLDVLESLHKIDASVRVLDFSRNFGHQIAITAGIDCSRGKAVVVMDADLQHPPEVIPEMIKKWKEGFDIVSTFREKTEGEGVFKRSTSVVFYKLLNKIANINISENAPDFRLLDRKVVDTLKSIRERARFVRGLVSWVGFRQTSIKFIAASRHAGKTKYSLTKMINFSFDGITSFSSFPLRIASYFGFFVSLVAFAYAIYAIYMKLFTESVIPGWTSILVAVLFVGGIQLITIGIIGEYIGRIYEESKQRPLYILKGTLGFDDRINVRKNDSAMPY